MKRRRGAAKAAALLAAFAFLADTGRCDWVQGRHSLAWTSGGSVVWRFSFDPAYGKPFFHPVRPVGGPAPLTQFKPKDHPWHYGLWFSWKYINHVNYWEEDRKTGAAQGKTRWSAPVLALRPDGTAVIRLDLEYVNPAGAVDLSEHREIRVSAPDPGGAYAIDWTARFTAGGAGALLDRLPMPGEPGGRVNGGYAGLAARLAPPPLRMAIVTPEGPIVRFSNDRARPASAAVGFNFADGDRPVGRLAIFSAPENAGREAPWYLIDAPGGFRFACAAILAPRPLALPPGGKLSLGYRIAVGPGAWTPRSLGAAVRSWLREPDPAP